MTSLAAEVVVPARYFSPSSFSAQELDEFLKGFIARVDGVKFVAVADKEGVCISKGIFSSQISIL